jgi:dTDP-glucose 4,6-dehydratase
MYDTIVEGTRHTLDFAARCSAEKVLLTSSGAVYGRQPSEMARVPETYENPENDADQRSAYADGKRAAEKLCSQYSEKYGIEISIARCFAFVGPYLPLDIHYAVGNFIRDGLRGEPIVVRGDGTPYRSYLYAADLAVWLWTILLKGRPCRPYNVGSDQAICISDLACKIAGFFENRPDVVVMGTKDLSAPVQRYVPDITRSRTELGLDIYTDIDEAIKRTLAFLKKTGSG